MIQTGMKTAKKRIVPSTGVMAAPIMSGLTVLAVMALGAIALTIIFSLT